MIYGANGYAGALIAEQAAERGLRPVLAGRSASKLAPLAERLGLQFVAFELSDARAAERALAGLDLVLHCAGPFVDTAEPMQRACLASRTSYLDITGEVPVFEAGYKFHEEALRQGIVLISGVGFDVVPTDCLARHVAGALPGASSLEIAFAGLGSTSPGTAKSMVDGALAGGIARRDGKLVSMPFGRGGRTVRFADKERTVLPIPWGDLSSAFRSTGVPSITTYMAFPRALAKQAALAWPVTAAAGPLLKLLGKSPLRGVVQGAIDKRIEGPSEQARQRGRSQVWASVRGPGGAVREAWLTTLDGYTFTVESSLLAVARVLAERPVGALTPAQAFGADFVLEIPNTQRFDRLP
ncbi:MAG TPA: saccharopine dehydrogenase NADP-binding domain-containing protein [Polyangiales bacterium]|nr:saccharopine dehydrogenase NADP-binding domain-containing protein [Polyangiales bacterium]